jgi:hypothetical protein
VLLGNSVSIEQVAQGMGGLMALAISYAALRISHLQYAGSSPIALVTSWTRLDLEGEETAPRLRLTIRFWNHRNYAVELANVRIAVPHRRFFSLQPHDPVALAYDTSVHFLEDRVIAPGESGSVDMVTPYAVDPRGIAPHPFAVDLTYLDPRKARYLSMWLYSGIDRPGRLRRWRDQVTYALYYPTLSWRIRWRGRKERLVGLFRGREPF